MTVTTRTPRSGARSRWHGARTKVVPRWTSRARATPPPDPAPRAVAATLIDVLLELPPPNGAHGS
jgi:hypothetical protein